MLVNSPYITLTEDNFQVEVLNARIPVLVDCWATWCGTFHQVNPVYSELAIAFSDHIKVGHLNIAVSEQLATSLRVRVVPTLLLFQHGQVIEKVVGSISQPDIANKLSYLLSGFPSSRSRVACL